MGDELRTVRFPIQVMVRGYQDEPSQLTAAGWQSKLVVEVFGERQDLTLGWHAEDVFDFDYEIFFDLKQAFINGERKKLLALWRNLDPWCYPKAEEQADG